MAIASTRMGLNMIENTQYESTRSAQVLKKADPMTILSNTVAEMNDQLQEVSNIQDEMRKTIRAQKKQIVRLETSLHIMVGFMIIFSLSVMIAFTTLYNTMKTQNEDYMYELQSMQSLMVESQKQLDQTNEKIDLLITSLETPKEEEKTPETPVITEPEISNPVNSTGLGVITQRTNLSADQFDRIIDTVLLPRGYTTSKMLGMGQALYDMEEQYDVNGLFILSIGSLESGYGTSYRANNKNDLYGLIGMSFDSIYDNTIYCGKLLRNHYMDTGRTTIDSIRQKYCPNSTKWTGDITWFMNLYTKTATEMLN